MLLSRWGAETARSAMPGILTDWPFSETRVLTPGLRERCLPIGTGKRGWAVAGRDCGKRYVFVNLSVQRIEKVQKTTAFISERMRVYKVGLCVFPQKKRTLANFFSFFKVKDQSNVAVFTFWPFSLLIICASVSLGNSRSCVDERRCDFWSWARKW